MVALIPSEKMLLIILILISVSLGSIGQVFMKYGMTSYGEVNLSLREAKRIILMIFQPFVFVGLGMYGISSILWLIILSKADLSFAYPMLGVGFVLSTFFGRFIFGEVITPLKIGGVVSVILGVILIGLGKYT